MRDRKRIAQGFSVLAALLLWVSGIFHGYGGLRVVFPAMQSSNLPAGVATSIGVIWLLVSSHWIFLGVLVLVIAFSRNAPRRLLLFLAGLVPLIDAAGAYHAVGLFIGDELLGAAAALLLLAALLFPKRPAW